MDNLLINGTRYISGSACKELILEQISSLLLIHKVLLGFSIILCVIIIILMYLYYKKVKNE
jgi:hypothetical protein